MSRNSQLTLHVTIKVSPSNIVAFLAALRPVWEKCASEAECLFFDVFQDPANRGSFRFVEVWTKDREWFETKQLTKDYYVPYEDVTRPMWLEERKLEYMEREEGWAYVAEDYLVGVKRD
jgi:quinol monooxygenase YgiN